MFRVEGEDKLQETIPWILERFAKKRDLHLCPEEATSGGHQDFDRRDRYPHERGQDGPYVMERSQAQRESGPVPPTSGGDAIGFCYAGSDRSPGRMPGGGISRDQ